MARQQLIYESVAPVTAARHADLCVEDSDSYAFTADVSAVPLMVAEFQRASVEYPIVFAADEGANVMPVVVLGVRDEQNLYLTPDARWKADYVPAFIRRHPFVFAAAGDGQSLTLCIDEARPGLNREGRGHALFDDGSKPTPYLEKVIEFLKEYHLHFERTREFGRRIKDIGLLKPVQANVITPEGDQVTLGGFMTADRDRLRDLDRDTLKLLTSNDELELLYLHLASLRNFESMKDRVGASHAGNIAPSSANLAPKSPDAVPAEASSAPSRPPRKPSARSERTSK